MKDFSTDQPKAYAQFRPSYPIALIKQIALLASYHGAAWDCATGNGQVAALLTNFFTAVYATDISATQMAEAPADKGIHYSMQPAEETNFPNHFFDLITVAQAIHWFDFEAFYKEVKRVLKPDGLLAVVGYNLMKVNPAIDAVILNFHNNILKDDWSAERHYVDDGYQTIPFPFTELKMPIVDMKYQWNYQQLLGYLNTWSAVKHYIKTKNENPIGLIESDLKKEWGNESVRTINFPLLLRLGKV